MDQIRCPHCGTYVEPPQGGGPFFCSSCHEVIDVHARRAGVSAAPDSPETEPPEPSPLPLGSPPPGHGLAAGQAPAFGYFLAAVVGLGAAYGLAHLAHTTVYVPVVGAALVGWLMSRALSIGSGGGSPDRTILGFLFLLLVCVSALGLATWMEYRAVHEREAVHWRTIFGSRGTETATLFVGRLRDRDRDLDGFVKLVEDGTTVRIEDEDWRAKQAIATGRSSKDPFDVHLLASTGRRGFEGFVLHRAKEGHLLRITPGHDGWQLTSTATLLLAAAELLTMLLFALHRRD